MSVQTRRCFPILRQEWVDCKGKIMRRVAIVLLTVLAWLLAMPGVAIGDDQHYLNTHCAAKGTHAEGGSGTGAYARAKLTLTNTSDPYTQCGYLRVKMYYKYQIPPGMGGGTAISSREDYAYPGNYPYSSSDDMVASVTTEGWSTSVIGCNHVDYAINVGGPGGIVKTWSHLC